MAHYQLEAIHPFRDGKGRVGRLLLALMIWKWCGLSMPWLYMSPFFERHKDEYIRRLFAVSADGNWVEWLRFSFLGLIEQASDRARRCILLTQLRSELQARVRTKAKRLHSIVEGLFASPNVSPIGKQEGPFLL